jgi:hypothetical protein
MNKVAVGLMSTKIVFFAVFSAKNAEKIFESRFWTVTPELDKLRNTLVNYGCSNVAMESTGLY